LWLFTVVFSTSTASTNYFNLAGQLIVSTDANGHSTFYGYDDRAISQREGDGV
jgi:YD repeat-containing protein